MYTDDNLSKTFVCMCIDGRIYVHLKMGTPYDTDIKIIRTDNLSIYKCSDDLLDEYNKLIYISIYAAILIVEVLYFIISATGTDTTWYIELLKGPVDPWVIRSLWIIATILSYVSLFLLLPDVMINERDTEETININMINRSRSVAPLFLIGIFMSLGWAVVFYYVQNIGLSLWLIIVLFSYTFWLFMYIWYIKPVAAVFLIPILVIYIYLMYSVTHLAYLNNVPL